MWDLICSTSGQSDPLGTGHETVEDGHTALVRLSQVGLRKHGTRCRRVTNRAEGKTDSKGGSTTVRERE